MAKGGRRPVTPGDRIAWTALRLVGVSAREIADIYGRHNSVILYNTCPAYRAARLNNAWDRDHLHRNADGTKKRPAHHHKQEVKDGDR